MKRLVASLFSLCLAVVFTVALAGKVAAQSVPGCSLSIGSSGGGASLSCGLTGYDADWCYYSCSCSGSSAACDRLYAINGLESY
jgi:hypothetical protein